MLPKPHHLAWYAYGVILTPGVAHAALRLLDIEQSTYPNIPSTCISALNQEVACDATLRLVVADLGNLGDPPPGVD
ncbi:hypothetical protein IMZ48_35600 [Candidatus Bathyarchaeota archaeon]|nr:hypothetical protein [Candidatus Bathyarchaeota archaeon]